MKITFSTVTRMMRKIEKIINWYNTKYNFQIDLASPKERIEYTNLLLRWDLLKTKRDSLKNK